MQNNQIIYSDEFVTQAGKSVTETRDILVSKRQADKLSSTVIRIHQKMDSRISKIVAEQPPKCGYGCDFCCHYRVMVSALEVLAIAEHIANWPAAHKAALLGKLNDHLKSLQGVTPGQHLKMNTPCVFLEGHACSIYAFRPIACRSHHEFESVKTCEETFFNPTSAAQGAKLAAIQAIGDGVKIGIAQHHAEEGLDENLYELGAALHEALTNPVCFKRYRKGKITFPSVGDRGCLCADNEL